MIKITWVETGTRHIRDEKYCLQTYIFCTIPKKTKPEEREEFDEQFKSAWEEIQEAINDILVRNGLLEWK